MTTTAELVGKPANNMVAASMEKEGLIYGYNASQGSVVAYKKASFDWTNKKGVTRSFKIVETEGKALLREV
jgi:hypothetical protein